MRITPLDVRKQEFRKAVRGLDADEVQAFLATVADEYEFVLTDNKKLREKVIELDEKVGEYRNMEKTLRDTLLTAERVMTEARQNARKEADLILRDAQMKASQEVAGISGRVESFHQQIRELRGHRDSYLARLQSLSEAQLGLINSYRKDFESTDTRIERAAEPIQQNFAEPAVAAAPAPVSGPAPTIPAWDAPAANAPQPATSPNDQWRGYDLEVGRNAAPEPPRQPMPEPADVAPTHLHTPDPEPTPWEDPGYPTEPEYPMFDESAPQTLAPADYDARVASVADAWSGSVPQVDAPNLPQGQAAAIDEVSVALGMFTEGSDMLEEPAPMEGESRSVPPMGSEPIPSSPWPSNELASDGVPVEPVDHAGGAMGSAADSTEASTGSDDQDDSEGGRWSLSRIARGLTGS